MILLGKQKDIYLRETTMRFRGVDINGDWIFGKGRNSYLKDNEALMMNIKTRLLEFLGDCFFDVEKGIDWWNLLGGKNLRKILVDVQRTILRSYQVKRIIDLDYSLKERALSITISIEFLDGGILTDTVEVFNA